MNPCFQALKGAKISRPCSPIASYSTLSLAKIFTRQAITILLQIFLQVAVKTQTMFT
eukprot:c43221_g1_i1 orf=699-869(+)